MNDTNENFIEVTKSTLKRVENFDITFTEAKILCKVLPAVQCRFDQVSICIIPFLITLILFLFLDIF